MPNNLKICIYAICKNEEAFVDRWYNSMKEADEIVVVDTGSTDNTVQKLKSLGIKVYQKIFSPWRFDKARNYSLSKISSDVDVCMSTDLDEVFEQGWRKKIEEVWIKNKTLQLRYKYVWNVLENGQDGLTFYYEKCHARNGFKWIYPVHEVLTFNDELKTENIAIANDLILRHYPDASKSRSQYLSLLELSVKENPENDRNTHYLAREYMFNNYLDKAIKMFKKHLSLKSSTWKDERSASLRYIGDCYFRKNNLKQAEKYYKKAIIECINTREPYLALAKFYYETKDYIMCIIVIKAMFDIKTRTLNYMSQSDCWNEIPYDLLYMSYYYLGNYKDAYDYCIKALTFEPQNSRIKSNLTIFKNLLESSL